MSGIINRQSFVPIKNIVLKGENGKPSLIEKYGESEFMVYYYLSIRERDGLVSTTMSNILYDLGWKDKKDKEIIKSCLINYSNEKLLIYGRQDKGLDLNGCGIHENIKVQLSEIHSNGSKGSYTNLYSRDIGMYDIFGHSKKKIFTLYCVLYSYYNKNIGFAYPTMETLQKITKFSKSTIINYLTWLENFGIIDIYREEDSVYYSRRAENNLPIRRDGNKYFFRSGEKKLILSQSPETSKEEFKKAQEGWYRPRKYGDSYEQIVQNAFNIGKQSDVMDNNYVSHSEQIKDATEIPF